MRIRPIAAGDSLVWTAQVPAEAGDLREASFEVVAERSDRGATVAGAVSSVNPDARTVTVQIPAGEMSPGLWRVQARVSGIDQVTTFILDAILDVLRSLLPLPSRMQRATLVLPRMGLSADGVGAQAGGSAYLMLPPLGASAEGIGGIPAAQADLRMMGLSLSAGAAQASFAMADVALAALGMTGAGQGQRLLATADARLPLPRIEAVGAGSVGAGSADVRLERVGIEATGSGLTSQAVATARMPGLSMSAEAGPAAHGLPHALPFALSAA